MANSEPAAINRQLVVNIGGNCFRILTSFLAAIVASRSLGSEGFGQTNIIIAATIILCYILTLGFDSSLPVLISRNLTSPYPEQRTLTTVKAAIISSGIFGLACGISSIFLLMLAEAFYPSIRPFFWAMVFMILHSVLLTHGNVLSGVLRGMKIFQPVVLRDQFVFPSVMLLSQIIAFHYFDAGIGGYGISSLLAAAIAYTVVLPSVIKIYKELRNNFPGKVRVSFSELWRDVKFSFPLGIMTTLEPLHVWTAVLIAGHFQSAAEVGYFSISLRLAVIAQFFATAIGPIFIPYMAGFAASKNTENMQRFYKQVFSICLRWSAFAFVAMGSFHKELFQIFGSAETEHKALLLATLAGIIVEGMFAPAKHTLIALGYTKINAILYTCAIIMNVILASLTSVKHGIIASAASFSVVIVFINLIRVIALHKSKQLRVFQWEDLMPIALAALFYVTIEFASHNVESTLSSTLIRAGGLSILAGLLFLPMLKEVYQVFRLRAIAQPEQTKDAREKGLINSNCR